MTRRLGRESDANSWHTQTRLHCRHFNLAATEACAIAHSFGKPKVADDCPAADSIIPQLMVDESTSASWAAVI
jgi:hypothetical protein